MDTIDVGETLYLPTARNEDCFECGPCEESGMSCRQLFRSDLVKWTVGLEDVRLYGRKIKSKKGRTD